MLSHIVDGCLATYPDAAHSDAEWARYVPHRMKVSGFKHAKANSQAGVHWITADRDGALFIFVRGSEDAWDWVRNATFWMDTGPFNEGDRVHRGFDLSAQEILHVEAERIEAVDQTNGPIILAGHSLGAATVTCLAAHMVAADITPAGVVSLCGPPVGNGNFCNLLWAALGHTYYRIERCRDLVPRIGQAIGLRHVGQQYYVDSRNGWNVFQDEDHGLWYRRFDRALQAAADWGRGRFGKRGGLATHHRLDQMAEIIRTTDSLPFSVTM